MMWERGEGEHNGHKNYETWAFLTHITQTESILNKALTVAAPLVHDEYHHRVIGETVVRAIREWCETEVEDGTRYDGRYQWNDARMMQHDVGSWWRIDENAVGRHMMAYIKDAA